MHARKNKNVEIPTCRNIQLLGTQLMLQGLEKDTTWLHLQNLWVLDEQDTIQLSGTEIALMMSTKEPSQCWYKMIAYFIILRWGRNWNS